MSISWKNRFFLAPVLATILLTGCVSANKFDALQAKYQQLLASYNSDQAQIQMLDGKLKVTFKDEILFPEGGYRLTAQSEAVLAKLVPAVSGLQQTKVVVDGYTDNVPIGPELQREGIATNFDLSSRRADSVVDYLRRQGVSPALMSAQGFGATNPVASNDTPEGRAKNRRIEVSLVGPGT
jgi:chemotaxis protein MotB